ncbi:MAG: hypothetical protein U0401_05420 [Anaerolineae bacterium]
MTTGAEAKLTAISSAKPYALNCIVHAIGGMEDHIHLVASVLQALYCRFCWWY